MKPVLLNAFREWSLFILRFCWNCMDEVRRSLILYNCHAYLPLYTKVFNVITKLLYVFSLVAKCAALIGSYLLTFRDNLKDTDILSLNAGNYQPTPHHFPEERLSHLNREGSLKWQARWSIMKCNASRSMWTGRVQKMEKPVTSTLRL